MQCYIRAMYLARLMVTDLYVYWMFLSYFKGNVIGKVSHCRPLAHCLPP